jgi:VIT1/CCC1 family predicted Fe2+/Mn2+ transporter
VHLCTPISLMRHRHHSENHRTQRIGWLRAAVLGANDGILSTSSLVVGVAAAHAARASIWVAGVAGLVAGAMSMAAGEYVSVSSRADTERADLKREREELKADNRGEHHTVIEMNILSGNRGSLWLKR